MKISVMRNIDFWIGIPICFILSLHRYLENTILRKKDKPISPKKILFLEFSEMGSAILAYSAMKRARDLFPQAQLLFWIFKRNAESVEVLDVVPGKNIITIRDNNFFVLMRDVFKGLVRIHRENIDVAIDMELFSRFSSILTYLSKARTRVGFYRFYQEGLYRGNLLDLKVQYNPHLHISANFIALVQSLKVSDRGVLLKESLSALEIKSPVFQSSMDVKDKMRKRLKDIKPALGASKRLIILNPLTSGLLPLRGWPVKNYSSLAKMLLRNPDNFVVMIGLESDSKERRVIAELAKHERCIDFIGKTSMVDLLDLFSISDLFITHDSGPVHFAALTKVNMIVLFGPETPLCYAPISPNTEIVYSGFACSPCVSAYNHRRSACRDNKCLQVIGVEQVYRLAEKHL